MQRLTATSLLLVLGLALGLSAASRADISGSVVDDVDGAPLAGALVSVRARPDIAPVFSAGDGSFVLPMAEKDIFEVAAAIAYDPDATVNYLTQAQQAFDGMSGIELRLPRLPSAQNASYQPPAAGDFCVACHSDYYNRWSSSRHAGAGINPWVLDLYSGDGTPSGSAGYVFLDTHDADDSGFCATCHTPLEDVFTPGQLKLNEAVTPAGLDGVTCLACHQMSHVNEDVTALHHLGNTQYRFPDGFAQTSFHVFGPLPDLDNLPMQNVYQPQFEESRFCASCHEYENPTTGAPGQTTYSEWAASPYAQPGPDHKTCQNCHMPALDAPGRIGTGGPERPGSQRHDHRFIGATPTTLSENISLRMDVERSGGLITVQAEVENQCGHNFPTGISLRNALLVIDARINGVPLTQTQGPTIPFWGSDEVPGEQPGDYAGKPGKGYAKVLEGRINGQGPVVRPVLFIDAEGVHSDTGIPSGGIDLTRYGFAVPAGTPENAQVSIEARLLYRRAWRAVAVTKGWTQTPGGMPVEIEVQRSQQAGTLASFGPGGGVPAVPIAVPVGPLTPWLLGGLLGMFGLIGWRVSRRG
ncbi:MAG: multiheme c-type cytochrome [Lysobacteraceae bacterium]